MLLTNYGGPTDLLQKRLREIFKRQDTHKFYDEVPWPPPNMKLVRQEDFWWARSSNSFKGEVWMGQKQFARSDTKKLSYCTPLLFLRDEGHMHKGGYVVLFFYDYPKHHVDVYTWGACSGKFRQETVGNCLTRYTCSRCKFSYDVDSSG